MLSQTRVKVQEQLQPDATRLAGLELTAGKSSLGLTSNGNTPAQNAQAPNDLWFYTALAASSDIAGRFPSRQYLQGLKRA
ncbi:hypothetical protein J7T55_004423 [Diaporthe amygdali]|uniref:uncharacterized protein n=1 Tax=Phomopsis amygdali TaxID=1214568 RepID=UPI0022FDEDF1|nr:uncharacterized protein J7T55_004423 [Diaporthe amygdali]KAJ0109873.1 hypothetical protein J7T55_004423 [Diaporthe amygdali]